MDIDTLLKRQMELHTTLRRVPKTPEMMFELHQSFQKYQNFLNRLKQLARKLLVEADAVFQCLIYLGGNGASNASRLQRDDAIRMRQAKVLAPEKSTKIEYKIRKSVPHDDLMSYVELANAVRNVYRMKVEDANDLQKVEKSITEAMEYLDFIYNSSGGEVQTMFSLFVAERADALVSMLHSQSDSKTGVELTVSSSGASSSVFPSSAFLPKDSGTPPSSPASFVEALAARCGVSGDVGRVAGERLRCANAIVDWIAGAPSGLLTAQLPRLLAVLTPCLDTLIAEMRSSLCRLGCEAAMVFVQRIMGSLGPAPDLPAALGPTLGLWAAALARRVFVTVVAISTAADLALREMVLCSAAHIAIVRAILAALDKGAQAELRRKCLGYLVLSVVSAHEPAAIGRLGCLLAEPAQKYVLIGDTRIRKMSRALCIVLSAICHVELNIEERTLRLMHQEKKELQPLLNSPRELEKTLFGPRNEIFPARPTALFDPEVALKPCSSPHQLRVDAGSLHSQHPLCHLASYDSRVQASSINQIRLPDIIKKRKTHTTEAIITDSADSFPNYRSKQSMGRRDTYNTDPTLPETDEESRRRQISSAEQMRFVLAMPKRSATALPEPIAMKKTFRQTKADNIPSQSATSFTLLDPKLLSFNHIPSEHTSMDFSDVLNIRQRLSGSGAKAHMRIIPLSLLHTTVCGGDVGYNVDGTISKGSVAHGDNTHGKQTEHPEPHLSNTLKQKLKVPKPREKNHEDLR
ncbi:unnamed protein product [Phytomonas sp. Hart1]|nr:unnamed protein product [Phytomonas sp. Hart1]|eukprot:CCW68120.1 unnamed protein product [Phytomonas sp. isolate Hart1]